MVKRISVIYNNDTTNVSTYVYYVYYVLMYFIYFQTTEGATNVTN